MQFSIFFVIVIVPDTPMDRFVLNRVWNPLAVSVGMEMNADRPSSDDSDQFG